VAVADLVLVRSMRLPVFTVAVCLMACVIRQADATGLRDLPRNTHVDHRVHLSARDRDQIVRLIATRTSQHIFSIYLYGPDKVWVSCGYNDLVAGKHPMRGDGFILQRTSSGWKIVEQLNWSDQFAT
jgi:hypothetical protein